jgi:hypothetical protein
MIPRAMLVVAYATGKASHARQVKGDDPDIKGHPGPPGWRLGLRLTTSPCKKKYCYETSRGGQGPPRAVEPMMMILTMHVPMNVKSPNNTSKWQMKFNSAFKGLTTGIRFEKYVVRRIRPCANVYLHKRRWYSITY